MIYAVLVFDESDTLIAKLENATSPQYNRSKNNADQVSFAVPRTDSKISEVVIGRRFEIVRYGGATDVLETSGYISEHGYSGEMYEISGFTEEIALSRYITPVSYGYPLSSEYATLADFFDEMSKRYEVVRIKDDWDSYDVPAESSNVDFTTNPTFVLLQGSGDPTVYPASGYITFRFQKSADELWERIRWVSDYDDEAGVTTTVEYRQGASAGAGAWSTPTPGALTDVVGLVPASQTDEYMDVKVNFATSSEETSPVLFSLEIIKSKAIDEVSSVTYEAAASSVSTPQIDASNRELLDLLIDVCEIVEWEFKLERGVLEMAESLGTNRFNEYSLVEE